MKNNLLWIGLIGVIIIALAYTGLTYLFSKHWAFTGIVAGFSWLLTAIAIVWYQRYRRK